MAIHCHLRAMSAFTCGGLVFLTLYNANAASHASVLASSPCIVALSHLIAFVSCSDKPRGGQSSGGFRILLSPGRVRVVPVLALAGFEVLFAAPLLGRDHPVQHEVVGFCVPLHARP